MCTLDLVVWISEIYQFNSLFHISYEAQAKLGFCSYKNDQHFMNDWMVWIMNLLE